MLLHGFLGSGRNLGAVARGWGALDPHLRFVLPDLPGHGRSPPLPPEASLESVAQGILDLAAHLGLDDPFDIVGHSLGGRVALQVRLLQPNRVRRVTLLDISPGPITSEDTTHVARVLAEAEDRAPSREAMRDALEARGLSRGLVEWLLMSGDPSPDGFVWRIDRAALERLHATTQRVDLWAAVEHPKAETRCIRGGDSTYVSPNDEARLLAAGVEVVVLEGAGHFLHVDRREALVECLNRWG